MSYKSKRKRDLNKYVEELAKELEYLTHPPQDSPERRAFRKIMYDLEKGLPEAGDVTRSSRCRW